MKKRVFHLLIAGLTLFLMTGCGDKEAASEDKVDNTADRVEEAELAVYVPQGKNQEFLKEVTKLYNEKHDTKLSLKITDVTPGPATTQMISPMLVANEKMPEIVLIQDTNAAGLLEQFPDSFYSATDYGFYKEHGKDFFEQKVNVLNEMSGGKAMGFAYDWGAVVNYYQHELFEQVGKKFEEIKSWDEMIEVGKQIKEKTGHNLLAIYETGEIDTVLAIMDQQNVPLLDKDGNVNLGTKAAENAARIIQRLIDEDLVTFYSDDQQKAYQEVAMIITGGWFATNMEMNFPSAENTWRIAPMFPYSENEPGKNPVSGGSSWYVPKNSDNPTAAAQLLDFALSDPDAQEAALNAGVLSANRIGYDSEAGEKEFPFYGNQKFLQIVKEASENSADVTIFPHSVDGRAYIGSASYEYWKNQNFKESYIKEADNFAQKYSISVNK